MADHILSIDQGTTGTTCLVFRVGASLELIGRGYNEFPQHFPQPGWVEHDLNEIWASVETAIAAALEDARIRGNQVAAIGITNQRETTGLWYEDGRPACRAIVWQDRRTSPRCDALKQQGHEDLIRQRTGLVVDPYFSGTKLGWLLDEVGGLRDAARADRLRFGTIDTWLVWNLTGGQSFATDATNASRTLLYDIHNGRWDEELCRVMGEIPAAILPEVRACNATFGQTKGVSGLPDGIPIAGIAGDQQAALFGQACFEPGMAKCTYGTGAFALVNTGEQPVASQHGVVTTIAWQLGDQVTYALEGSAFVAGAVVQWLRDGLGIIGSSSEVEQLARQVEDSGGVVLVPALTGLGAPHWRPEARGLISGITRGTTRAHLARAALEGVALQIYDLLDAMKRDAGRELSVLRVDGGAAANDLLMQYQADILRVEIHRPSMVETTALGAAHLAALGVGIFDSLEAVANAWLLEKTFEPNMQADVRAAHLDRWHQAVLKT